MDDAPSIHETAIVEPDVTIGAGTSVWDGVHLRRGARVGRGCILGEKTYLAPAVVVGDLCKLNACVYLCAGVTLHDGVMLAAHTVFTNDALPRATDPDVAALRPSEPTAQTLRTTVCRGATVGANCTIGPGVTLGAWCMVGMGSVVTKDVPPHALVRGNPARQVGRVCACGAVVCRADADGALPAGPHRCGCGRELA
jgi:acetyltransferase-like isoleucine patch superfamily enzyme